MTPLEVGYKKKKIKQSKRFTFFILSSSWFWSCIQYFLPKILSAQTHTNFFRTNGHSERPPNYFEESIVVHPPQYSCHGSFQVLAFSSLSFPLCNLLPSLILIHSLQFLTSLCGKCHFLHLSPTDWWAPLHRALPFLPSPHLPPSMFSVLPRATDFCFPPRSTLGLFQSVFVPYTICYMLLHPIISRRFVTVDFWFPSFQVLVPSILFARRMLSLRAALGFPVCCPSGQCQPQTELWLISYFSPQLKEKNMMCPPDIPWWIPGRGQKAKSFHISSQLLHSYTQTCNLVFLWFGPSVQALYKYFHSFLPCAFCTSSHVCSASCAVFPVSAILFTQDWLCSPRTARSLSTCSSCLYCQLLSYASFRSFYSLLCKQKPPLIFSVTSFSSTCEAFWFLRCWAFPSWGQGRQAIFPMEEFLTT